MKKIRSYIYAGVSCSVLALAALVSPAAFAKTPAGTPIKNQATLNFSMGSAPAQQTISNESVFLVQEVIDVVVVWADAVNIQTASPDTDKVLSFLMTNTGNGDQKYNLTFERDLTGDDFNPVVRSNGTTVYVESGAATGLQLVGPSADTPYSGTLDLTGGQSKVVFLVFDIPPNLQPTNKGFADLKVMSSTPGITNATATGLILPGAGKDGVDIVVGPSHGQGRARGIYEVNQSIVNVVKNVVSIVDPNNGNQPLSQAFLTYEILIESKGTGLISDFNLEDAIPPEVDYVAGSITINGVVKTDASDSDEATFLNNTIYLKLGNATAPNTFKVQYRTRIK